MENYFLLSLCVLFTLSAAQEPLAVSFKDDSTRFVTAEATDIGFTCELNRDLLFMVKNKVELVRKPADESQDEVILSLAGQLQGAEPSFYSISVIQGPPVGVSFSIKQVRDLDDGKLVCRATQDGDVVEASVDIVVIRPLESLSLVFDGKTQISESTSSPVEVDAGAYSVQCIAEGSNPEPTSVHLLLHGNPVDHNEPMTEQYFTDGVRKFRTKITGRVDLTIAHSGQEIECTASSKANDNHVVKLPVKINVYDPKVTCNDSYAYPGKMYPVLTCVVDHEGIFDIDEYMFELGESKETIRVGDNHPDYVEMKVENKGPSKTLVHLDLYSAKDWHFESDFVLLIKQRNGHVTKQSVRLLKTAGEETENREGEEDPGNSAPSVMSSLAVTLLALVASWLQYP